MNLADVSSTEVCEALLKIAKPLPTELALDALATVMLVVAGYDDEVINQAFADILAAMEQMIESRDEVAH